MTVGEKMHQTLASLEPAAANLKSFSLNTQDPHAKSAFATYAQQLESICQGLRERVNYIEQQEPQYHVMQAQEQRQGQ